MSHPILNIDQSPQELNELYGDKDYYWYLRSPQFHEAFLKPLGGIVNRLAMGEGCLDVGCGEGQLSQHIRGRYFGVDGSEEAIKRGMRYNPDRNIVVGRLEHPEHWSPNRTFPVVVFSGILEVLVRPESRVELLFQYFRLFCPGYYVIHDLERLDAANISKEFELLEEHHWSATGIDLVEAKLHRKALVYKC